MSTRQFGEEKIQLDSIDNLQWFDSDPVLTRSRGQSVSLLEDEGR